MYPPRVECLFYPVLWRRINQRGGGKKGQGRASGSGINASSWKQTGEVAEMVQGEGRWLKSREAQQVSGTNPAVTLLTQRKRRAPCQHRSRGVLGAAPVAWRRLHKQGPRKERLGWSHGLAVGGREPGQPLQSGKTCLRPTL